MRAGDKKRRRSPSYSSQKSQQSAHSRRSASASSSSSSSSSSSNSSSSHPAEDDDLAEQSDDDVKLDEHDPVLDRSIKKVIPVYESDNENDGSQSIGAQSADDRSVEIAVKSPSASSDFVEMLEILRGPPDGSENKMSNKQLQRLIANMKAWWTAAVPKGTSFIKHAASRWGRCSDGNTVAEKVKMKSLTSLDLRYVYYKEMFKRIRLDALLRQRGFLETAGGADSAIVEDVAGVGYAQDLGMIQDCIARAHQLLMAELQFRKSLDPSVDQGCPTLADSFGYVPFTEGKLNDYQTFLVFLLRALHDNSYRRYNGAVYEQIFTPIVQGADGKVGRFATHAWKRVSDIKDFVIQRASKEDNFSQWQTLTTGNSLERATHYLSSCADAEFAQLKPNRLWHAFHNGLYFVDMQDFYRYGDPRIPADMVACKYHDQVFDESIIAENWTDVVVPHLDDVITYQYPITTHEKSCFKSGCEQYHHQPDEHTPDCYTSSCHHLIHDEMEQKRIVMWIYAFIGRMLYEVSQKDKWQVMPFIVGRAGTGKSLLLKCVAHFFNAEDVETLANNSQRGFGLETLVDKLMWMCLEVKNDFTLDQAQLQSMISGEDVSIMRKNKTALGVLWTVPGILAGNELANWVDNSGSMSRRMILSFWDKKVRADDVDPYLDMKVKARIGNLLHKSSCAYAAVYGEFGDRDIWGKSKVIVDGKEVISMKTNKPLTDTILPLYFHAARNRFQTLSDPLMAFLKSETSVILNESCRGMSLERFKACANNYFQKENNKTFQWKETKYKAVFEDVGIKKVKIDAKFIEAYGKDGIFEDRDGQVYGINTDWLLGVQEKDAPQTRKRGAGLGEDLE
jgi:hypothetical protein